MSQPKLKILLAGTGGIGTVTAYALETGGRAEVTAILRSNYAVVKEHGFTIDSVDHGHIQGWRPTHSTLPLLYQSVVLTNGNEQSATQSQQPKKPPSTI